MQDTICRDDRIVEPFELLRCPGRDNLYERSWKLIRNVKKHHFHLQHNLVGDAIITLRKRTFPKSSVLRIKDAWNLCQGKPLHSKNLSLFQLTLSLSSALLRSSSSSATSFAFLAMESFRRFFRASSEALWAFISLRVSSRSPLRDFL